MLGEKEKALSMNVGSRDYRAPEVENSTGYTALCDVYSLGKTMLALLTDLEKLAEIKPSYELLDIVS